MIAPKTRLLLKKNVQSLKNIHETFFIYFWRENSNHELTIWTGTQEKNGGFQMVE